MTHSATPLEMLREVTQRLDELAIPYLSGGSVAAALHGEPRTSLDIDLVVELELDDIERFAARFAADFYSSAAAMQEAVRDRRSFNLIHLESAWKLDFFVRGDTEFDRVEFRRRSAVSIGDPPFEVVVKSAEDSVLRKLQRFRLGGEVAQLQWRDITGILRQRRGLLDERHLDVWAAVLGVVDLLARARRES